MPRTFYWDGLLLLMGAAVAHCCHAYLISIPVGIFAIITLGISLKKELGL